MKLIHILRPVLGLGLGLLMCALGATPAAAWKPKTHIYLAEQARMDAVDDGKVTIYETDYATGKILAPLGTFEVNPAVLAALRQKPEQFRAGVVGPDAYPDILTGQQLIHPGTNKNLLGDPAKGELPSAGGSDAWLTHLWRKAYGPKSEAQRQLEQSQAAVLLGLRPSDTPEIRAFVAGYVTHAAGDMFMHTFVNHYTGGDFAISPDPRNALKHIILEGYVGKRTPSFSARASIDGVDGFIYREMVRGSPDSALDQRLLQGAGDKASIPAIYSQLRNGLQRDVDAYERERMSRSGPSRLTYAATNGPEAEYKKAWIEDIDEGLRAWPQVSHQIALAIVYNDADPKQAKAVATKYLEDHLISMSGAPDFAVATVVFIRKVTASILPKVLTDAISELTKAPLDWMIKQSTGRSLDEWSAYINAPEVNFDPVMNAPGGGYGGQRETLVSLGDFNRKVLKIDDPANQFPDRRFKIDDFPPAFNTVQMTKIAFLSEQGAKDLLAALKAKGVNVPAMPTAPGKYESAMLGFLTSMDGGNRWQGVSESGAKSGAAFFLARGDAGGWRRLFLKQIGESENWTKDAAPEKDETALLDDTGFNPVQMWAVRLDDVAYGAADGKSRNVVITATFRNDTAQNLPFNEKTARALVERKDGSPIASLRVGYVHQTQDALPPWHYLPDTPIPPKGRITVRYVYEVGDKAAQQQLQMWNVIEQTPKVEGLKIKFVDGKSIRIPLTPLGKDARGDAPAEALPQTTGGVASTAFTRAGALSYRVDAAGRRGGPTAPIEVALTARNDADKRMSLQTAYNTFVLIGSDGAEYRTDGNDYGRSGAERMKYGRRLQKGEQAVLTLVFPKPPASVSAARLLVKSDTGTAEFYISGAPPTRPTYAPLPQPTGVPAGQPVKLNKFNARLISMNQGDDGDWEAVVGFKIDSGMMRRLVVADLDISIADASGETRHAAGNFYLAADLSRKPGPATMMLMPQPEMPIRFWFPESSGLRPDRYRIYESYGTANGGPISDGILSGNAR